LKVIFLSDTPPRALLLANTSQIDLVILSVVGEHWTKVAMVILRVVNAMGHDLPPGDEGYEVIPEG
jgi:hypothetical protein